jgi:hypothetical protein
MRTRELRRVEGHLAKLDRETGELSYCAVGVAWEFGLGHRWRNAGRRFDPERTLLAYICGGTLSDTATRQLGLVKSELNEVIGLHDAHHLEFWQTADCVEYGVKHGVSPSEAAARLGYVG